MRVIFPKSEQKNFIKRVCRKTSLRKFLMDNRLELPYSTFKKYYSEKLSLPLPLFEVLCKIGKIPENELTVNTVNENWGNIKGGKNGMKSLLNKYDRTILNSWRSKGGKLSKSGGRNAKNIRMMNDIDSNLAELIGLYLGDGTLTQYFLRISGDKRYDSHYFDYISSLVQNTTGIVPAIRKEDKRNIMYLEIRSVKFCKLLHDQFGFPYGDKIRGGAKIPEQIMNNSELGKACLRGLMDTDGSICRRGNSMCLAFSSHSNILRDQVWEIGNKMGVFSHKSEHEVGTNSLRNISIFFSLVGSANIRHIIRFCEMCESKRFLYKEEIPHYFNKYKGVNLPYRARSPVG